MAYSKKSNYERASALADRCIRGGRVRVTPRYHGPRFSAPIYDFVRSHSLNGSARPSLEIFGRRPLEPAASLIGPASENLHIGESRLELLPEQTRGQEFDEQLRPGRQHLGCRPDCMNFSPIGEKG
jgi:hypothetical protein